jgi:hypothetical protein
MRNRKNVGERVRRYGLRSQGGIPYFRSRELLKDNGFVISQKGENCLFPSAGSETMKHWLVKAAIFKILRGMKRRVGTEVEVNGGIVDVLDMDNMIAYEVETNLTRERLKAKLSSLAGLNDVFFIDASDVPDDIYEAELYLRGKMV